MINSRILNMTAVAITTCNSNILDILNNKMNRNKQQLNMYSQNMMNNQTGARRMYRSLVNIVAAVTLLMTTLEKTR
jgi:hypothetical protein